MQYCFDVAEYLPCGAIQAQFATHIFDRGLKQFLRLLRNHSTLRGPIIKSLVRQNCSASAGRSAFEGRGGSALRKPRVRGST